jgi:hypothetical protein
VDINLIKEIKKIINKDDCRCIVLQSPQGSGKNEFIHKLYEGLSYLAPSKILVGQQHNKYGGNQLVGFSEIYIGNGEKIISTFASSAMAHASDNNLLVVDEFHKILEFASFAYETTENTLDTINEFCMNNGKVILMSATPEPMIEFFDIVGYKNVKIDYLVKVIPKNQKKYLNQLVVVPAKAHFINTIKALQIKNYPSKQVGLISTKKGLKTIMEGLTIHKCNAIGISAENRESNSIKPHFANIVNTGLLQHNILNATSFIDCGINLNNYDIDFLYFDGYSVASAKQFFCRARNSMPTGYIQLRQLDSIESKQLKYGKIILYEKLYRNAEYLCQQYEEGLILDNAMEKIIGIVKSRNGEYLVSKLAIWCYVKQTQDKHNLSEFEFTSSILEGYYNEIKWYHSEKYCVSQQKEVQEYLDTFIDKKLYITDTKEIIVKLNNMGIKGTMFKPLMKRYGYNVENAQNHSWYTIQKKI